MWEHSGLNGGKASDWLRLCCVTRSCVQLFRSDNLNNTQLEYGDSVNGIAFPQSLEGNQLT